MRTRLLSSTLVASLLLAGIEVARAQDDFGVEQGMVNINGAASFAINHGVDDPESETSTWALSAAVGYFVIDPLSINARPAVIGNFDGDTAVSLHFTGAYHLFPRQRFTPYIEGGLGFVHLDFDQGGASIDETDGSYLVGGGIKYFLAENISLNAGLEYLAFFDFPDEGDLTWGVGFGLYF